MTEKRLHAHVSGRVQGVGFRFFTEAAAARLGLRGWVRNQPDGSVEILAEGPEDRLQELTELVRHGPRSAHVDSVRTSWSDPRGDLGPFRVRHR